MFDGALEFLTDHPFMASAFAFLLGAVVGSFLNVCIYRWPLQKSVLWPGSRCGSCLAPVKWYDNIPLVSYWRLRGKCRACGVEYSARYFWVELFCALAFGGLYWLIVVENFRAIGLVFVSDSQVTLQVIQEQLKARGRHDLAARVLEVQQCLILVWLHHVVLFCLLFVASLIDFDHHQIPYEVTVPGVILGLLLSLLMPWPWPMSAQEALPASTLHAHLVQYGGFLLDQKAIHPVPGAAQLWPVWQPLPDWLPPGTWQLGLATSVVGAAAGTLLVRLLRAVFSYAFDKEAMGLGDADLMMMIGAFLGWQSMLLVMVAAVFLGLLYAIVLVIRSKGGELPFGPFLAGGAMLVLLGSRWILPAAQSLLFDPPVLLFLAFVFTVLAVFFTLTLRMLRLVRRAA